MVAGAPLLPLLLPRRLVSGVAARGPALCSAFSSPLSLEARRAAASSAPAAAASAAAPARTGRSGPGRRAEPPPAATGIFLVPTALRRSALPLSSSSSSSSSFVGAGSALAPAAGRGAAATPGAAAPWAAPRDDGDGDDEDTIYALSTGSAGAGAVVTAVAVVRISGPHVSSLVLPSLLASPRQVRRVLEGPRLAHLCTLYEPPPPPAEGGGPEGDRHALDRAVVLYFPGPRSFTGQDVLELHLHGSRAVVSDVLHALEAIGRRHDARGGAERGTAATVRMAEPGEFTQRAFAAGKLDALQTEALADLLRSDTSAQRRQALRQLDGSLSRVYQRWRDELVAGLAHAEAVIDFGDDEALDDHVDHYDDAEGEDVRGMSVWGNVVERMGALRSEMRRQLSDERRGELVREGVRVVVAGPPNAGKSTLFNLLARRDAAIVSPVAGTTRDVLEVQLDLGGVKCRLLDTAGVRSETAPDSPAGSQPGANEIGEIERIGIGRAVAAVREADVVVAMVDAADAEAGAKVLRSIFAPRGKEEAGEEEETDDEDNEDDGRMAPVLLVLNKSDLTNGASAAPSTETTATTNEGPPYASLVSRAGLDRRVERVFEISCATQHGLDGFLSSLASTVAERVNGGGRGGSDRSPSSSSVLITRARHRRHVAATVECLDRFLALAGHGAPAMDLAAEELRLAASELGRVTGAVDVEDVLDKLFADFCIGK